MTHLFNFIFVLVTSFSLVFTPTAHAGNIASTVVNTANQLVGSLVNSKIQTQQMNQQQQLMYKLSSSKYPNDMFPNCLNIDAHIPDTNKPLCQGPIGGPVENNPARMQIEMYRDLAFFNFDQYQYYLKDGANLKNMTPAMSQVDPKINMSQNQMGVRCLTESKEQTRIALENRLASLRKIRDEVQKNNRLFEAQAQKRVDEIKEYDAVLNGGKGAVSSANSRTNNPLFKQITDDANCRSILSADKMNETLKNGIRGGLQKSVNEIRLDKDGKNIALDLLNNKDAIKNDINKMAKKIADQVNLVGIDKVSPADFKTTSAFGISDSSAFKSYVGDAVTDVKKQIKQLETEAKEKGIDIPGLFKYGSTDFDQKIRQYQINQEELCTKRKIGLGANDSWKKFLDKMENTDNKMLSKNNLEWFKSELLDPLDRDDLTSVEKLKKIVALDSKRNDKRLSVRVNSTYNATEAGNRDWNISAFFSKVVSDCQNELTNNASLYSADASGNIKLKPQEEGLSAKDIMSQAKVLQGKFKIIEKSSAAQIAQSLSNKMINCQDKGDSMDYTNSTAQCNKDKISLDKPQFCLNQSVVCAGSMQTCGQKVDKLIDEIQSKMNVAAVAHNASIESYKNQQQKLLDTVKTAFASQADNLQKWFRPKEGFNVPGDLTIDFSKMNFEKDVALADPKELTKILTDKMKLIEDEMIKQNKNVTTAMDDEIKRWKSTWEAEQERWKDIQKTCEDVLNQHVQDFAASQKALADANAEKMKKLKPFCVSLQSRVPPGCSGNSDAGALSEDVANILSFESGRSVSSYYSSICAQMGQEGDKDSEGKSNSTPSVATASERSEYCKNPESQYKEDCTNLVKTNDPNAQKSAIETINSVIAKQKSKNKQGEKQRIVASVGEEVPVIPECQNLDGDSSGSGGLVSALGDLAVGAATLAQ